MRSLIAGVLTLAVRVQAGTPIGKALSMLSDLQATLIQDGKVAQQEYEEFSEWCGDRARDLGFEIKRGKAESQSLKASIADETAKISSLQAKSENLASSIAKNERNLKAATAMRAKENSDFFAEEKELMDTVDMLKRATGILDREMKGGASMLQTTADSLEQAFAAMVQASFINSADAGRLVAFAQESQKAEDAGEVEAPGAPAATAYTSHSGDIVETLQGLIEKADSQLTSVRNKETSDLHNFHLLKQSLEDELRFATQDLKDAKKEITASSEKKSTATGDLDTTSKDLAADLKSRKSLHHDCMTKASSFEAETRSRGEELKTLAEAKKIINEATGAAASGEVSLMQVARSKLSSDDHEATLRALHLVRDLARQQGSGVLMQLASRMSSAMHSQDPFEKIKGLISDMIATLEEDAEADASKKAYCDKELSETNSKKSDKTTEIKKLTIKIDKMSAQSTQLKEDVASLQKSLADLAKSQAEMDRVREQEHAAWSAGKSDLEKALSGIKLALNVLHEYYGKEEKAHTAAEGASSGIIGLLEVCEEDFSKNLAQVTADEELAVGEYEQVSKDNEIEKVAKEQDVKHKTKELQHLEKSSSESTLDRTNVQTELDAVLEYLSRIESECIAKAETYATRKDRRETEIAGLKDALTILESELALVQTRAQRRAFRGRRFGMRLS